MPRWPHRARAERSERRTRGPAPAGGVDGSGTERSSVCVLSGYPFAAARAFVNAPFGPNTVSFSILSHSPRSSTVNRSSIGW